MAPHTSSCYYNNYTTHYLHYVTLNYITFLSVPIVNEIPDLVRVPRMDRASARVTKLQFAWNEMKGKEGKAPFRWKMVLCVMHTKSVEREEKNIQRWREIFLPLVNMEMVFLGWKNRIKVWNIQPNNRCITKKDNTTKCLAVPWSWLSGQGSWTCDQEVQGWIFRLDHAGERHEWIELPQKLALLYSYQTIVPIAL